LLPEFIPPQQWPPNSPDLNQVDHSVWEILQEKVYYKTYVTDLELSKTPLTNVCRSDDMIQLDAFCSLSLDLAGRSTALAPPCLLLCFDNNVTISYRFIYLFYFDIETISCVGCLCFEGDD